METFGDQNCRSDGAGAAVPLGAVDVDPPGPAGNVLHELTEGPLAGDAGIEHWGGNVFAAGADQGMLRKFRRQVDQQ